MISPPISFSHVENNVKSGIRSDTAWETKAVLSPPIRQHVLGADIDALAAEDAVVALHAARFNRGVDVDAHRAFAVAFLAVDALLGLGADAHLRQMQQSADRHARAEERTHPADAVARAPATQRKVEHEE